MTADCPGNHRYFVAEVIGVPAEGRAVILLVCTACGEAKSHEFKVAENSVPLMLKTEKSHKE